MLQTGSELCDCHLAFLCFEHLDTSVLAIDLDLTLMITFDVLVVRDCHALVAEVVGAFSTSSFAKGLPELLLFAFR